MSASVIVACPSCSQKNRILVPLPTSKMAICGRCHSQLDADDPDDSIDDGDIVDDDGEDEALEMEGEQE